MNHEQACLIYFFFFISFASIFFFSSQFLYPACCLDSFAMMAIFFCFLGAAVASGIPYHITVLPIPVRDLGDILRGNQST